MGLLSFLRSICTFEQQPAPARNAESQTQSQLPTEESILDSSIYFPLTSLPVDLFRIIKLFLTNEEYHLLLNTCKHPQLRSAKAQYIFYNLPGKESWRYYLNQSHFYERISSIIENKSKQLALTLSDVLTGPKPMIEDISLLCNLRSLTLRNVTIDCDLLGEIRFVKKLCLESFPSLVFVPKLDGNIEEVVIKEFPLLVDITNLAEFPKVTLVFCPMLQDITPIRDCPDLTIKSCGRLEDVSCLGSQKKLNLSYCHRINNEIRNLNSVRSLTIRECEGIRDLSVLSSVEDLNIHLNDVILPAISHSKKVTFFSTSFDFGSSSSTFHCESLVFERNYNYNYLHQLPKFSPSLREIRFLQCTVISFDPLPLQNLYKLELKNCSLSSVDALGHIPVLIIRFWWDKLDLKGLGKATQKHVILEGLSGATGFQALKYVKRVEIITCSQFTSISDLKYCEEIVIEDCKNFTHLSPIDLSANWRFIRIIDCLQFLSLDDLRRLPNFEVRGSKIRGITLLPKDEFKTLGELTLSEVGIPSKVFHRSPMTHSRCFIFSEKSSNTSKIKFIGEISLPLSKKTK
eukprot:gene7992-8637_t